MVDLVIRGARVYDGWGGPPYDADVAVHGDRIVAVGEVPERGARERDAHGLALAPGFIDVHSHDDVAMLLQPMVEWKVLQGVTTQIVGNCGFGPAPWSQARRSFRSWHPAMDTLPRWSGYRGYLMAIDNEPPSLNVAVLVGHGAIRHAVLGDQERAPDAAEAKRIRDLLEEGLRAGAVGLSTGLIYEPGRFAATDELVELVVGLAGTSAVYATHLRDEGDHLPEAVAEAIWIAEATSVSLQISHHKASGRRNWGRVRESLRLIEEARARGVEVTADQYPYTASSTALRDVLRSGALDDGGPLGRLEPESVRVAAAPGRPEWEGRTLAELGAGFDAEPAETAGRVLGQGGEVVVVLEAMSEDDVRTVLRHPSTMIGSDGLPTGSRPHPRLWGTFPRVLGRYVRDQRILPLETAVHRMTAMPARKFRLADRGMVAAGAFADLVLFDPRTVIDLATIEQPRRPPSGIEAVLVNGVSVVEAGWHTHARPGRALRRGR
jgi:N-acyl-D-aspartate/D-glutamate deacylase